MTTYAGDNPEHLLLAGQSILNQTHQPDEFIIIADGPLSNASHNTIEILKKEASEKNILLKHRSLPENCGAAMALNAGLDLLECTWVARMDADDYAVPERLEKQIHFVKNNKDVDVLFTAQAEFYEAHERVDALKYVPVEHEKIVHLLRWRNIISHPTVLMRRSLLMAVEGYNSVHYLEDYDLYMRMIQKNARFAALQEPMVRVRVSPQQLYRRGGWRYAMTELKFRFNLKRRGMIKWHQWIISSPLYFLFRLAPTFFKKHLYRLVRKAP